MQYQFFSQTQNPAANRVVGDFVSVGIWGEADRLRDYCTMGVFSGAGLLVGGVVYHNWAPDEGVIEISSFARARNWMSRTIIRAAYAMPFDLLGCQSIVSRYSSAAKHIGKFWRSLGAIEVNLPRLRGKHEPDETLAILTDDAWLASKWGQGILHG